MGLSHIYVVSGILTRERLSTSHFRRTSNLPACCRACLFKAIVSAVSSILTASGTLHPLGSVSKARRSALLFLLLESDLFSPSLGFFGRPRSMMLPAMLVLSVEAIRLWLSVRELERDSTAEMGAGISVAVSEVGVEESVRHDLGKSWLSVGTAERGVAKVEVDIEEYAVVADPGVVLVEFVAERGPGVYGVLDLGESSGRADRGHSLLELPDLRRLNDSCLFIDDGEEDI